MPAKRRLAPLMGLPGKGCKQGSPLPQANPSLLQWNQRLEEVMPQDRTRRASQAIPS